MMQSLPTLNLLRDYEDGDGIGWEAEFAMLREESFHPAILYSIARTALTGGITNPVLLGPDGRVWDGHHRLCVAHDFGIENVPVEYAKDSK